MLGNQPDKRRQDRSRHTNRQDDAATDGGAVEAPSRNGIERRRPSGKRAWHSAYRSRTTSFGLLSSLRPMNRVCRRWCSTVHSTNSNRPTSTGFSQRQSITFFAVKLAEHLIHAALIRVVILGAFIRLAHNGHL